MEKQIIRIDASSLKVSSCFRRFYLTVVGGYRGKKLTNDILFGSAFHKCVETYAVTNDEMAANQKAVTYFLEHKGEYEVKKNAEFLHEGSLALTCMKYFAQSKTNPIFKNAEVVKVEGQPLVEKKFSIPIYSSEKVDILVQGTIDGVYKLRSGCLCIGDWKTTRARDPESYLAGYKLNVQLRVYVWALKKLLAENPNSEFAQLVNSFPKVGAFIYGAFLNSKDVEFKQSEIFFYGDNDLQLFESYLMMQAKQLANYYTDSLLPPPDGIFNNSCQTPFGSNCPFYGGCSIGISMDETESERMLYAHLNNHFIQKPYEPLKFGGGD